MSLLDRIQQNLKNIGQSPAAGGGGVPQQDTGLAARNLLAMKSGKEVAAPTAAMSQIGEQAANVDTAAALKDVRQQGAIQAEAIGTAADIQKIDKDQAQQGVLVKRDALAAQDRMRTTETLQQLSRDRKTLDFEKDKAKLEQVAAEMALSDTKYIDNLMRNAKRAELDTELGFNKALTESKLGFSTTLLKKHIGNKQILDMDEREWKRYLGRINIDDALAAAQESARSGQAARQGQQMGKLGDAAISYGGEQYKDNKKKAK